MEAPPMFDKSMTISELNEAEPIEYIEGNIKYQIYLISDIKFIVIKIKVLEKDTSYATEKLYLEELYEKNDVFRQFTSVQKLINFFQKKIEKKNVALREKNNILQLTTKFFDTEGQEENVVFDLAMMEESYDEKVRKLEKKILKIETDLKQQSNEDLKEKYNQFNNILMEKNKELSQKLEENNKELNNLIKKQSEESIKVINELKEGLSKSSEKQKIIDIQITEKFKLKDEEMKQKLNENIQKISGQLKANENSSNQKITEVFKKLSEIDLKINSKIDKTHMEINEKLKMKSSKDSENSLNKDAINNIVNNLKEQIDDLKAIIEKNKKDFDDKILKNTKEIYDNNVIHLNSTLLKRDKKIDEFNNSLLSKISDFQNENKKEIANLKECIENNKYEGVDYSDEIESLNNKFEEIKKNLEAKSKEVKEIKDGLLFKDKQISEIMQKMNQKDKIIGELSSRLKAQEDEMKEIKETLKSQNAKPKIEPFLIKKNQDLMVTAINQIIKKKVTDYKLIYRASVNGDSAKTFHAFCDEIPNNFVAIKSAEGYVFGGFTTQTWEGDNEWKEDSEAFILSFDKSAFAKIKQGKDAIYCLPSIGPCFGFDILLCDKCLDKKESFTYEESNQTSYGLNNFSEDGKANHLLIEDYEVYQIIFE